MVVMMMMVVVVVATPGEATCSGSTRSIYATTRTRTILVVRAWILKKLSLILRHLIQNMCEGLASG
mgnify:CR=1 FL=1